jgi:Zn finger protein HypA/HybF involved in hydrogenase expression
MILTMAGARTECRACHADVHRGQFAGKESGVTDCGSCHSPENWKAPKFDHNSSARFKLDGAHKNVPCKQCHRPTEKDGEMFVAYKPLDTTCVSCHGNTIPSVKEKKS